MENQKNKYIDNEKCLGCKYCIEEFDDLDRVFYSCLVIRLINFKFGKSFDDSIDPDDLCHVDGNFCLEFYCDDSLFDSDYVDL